jgi:membrane-associated phospholipid phosphatase
VNPHHRPAALAAAVALGASLALPSPAAAAEPVLRPSYDLATDAAVTAIAGGATLGLMALKPQLAPAACRWCNPPGFDADVTRALAWRNTDAAGTASDVLVVVLGAGALGNALLDGVRRDGAELGIANVLLITEATSIAMLVDTGVKYAAGRARPYAYLGRQVTDPRDANLSFFSGHMTFAFAVAASSATLLLSQHVPGAEWMSAAAFVAAGAVGYLRVAAEQHYLTDVLAGAAVGTVVGWAVPYLFHRPRGDAGGGGLQVRPAPGGIAIAW